MIPVPGVGLTPTEKPEKDDLSLALHAARKSTASMGKFTPELRKEKPAKNVGKKRKVSCANYYRYYLFILFLESISCGRT